MATAHISSPPAPSATNHPCNSQTFSMSKTFDAESLLIPLQTVANLDAMDGFDPFKSFEISRQEALKPWLEWTLEDFEIGRPLGKGALGNVYLARTKRDKIIVALKVIHMCKFSIESQEVIQREAQIHRYLEHKSIIQMYGYFRDHDKIIFVLEFAPGGELYTQLSLEPNGRMSEQRVATYIYELTEGLEYLHSKGIFHRDIKPENLLVGYHGELKMADFGWSIQINPSISPRRRTMCGTTEYMPPEMVKGNKYDAKVDIWCVGVLIYELLSGKPPFNCQRDAFGKSKEREATNKLILIGDYNIPHFFSCEVVDLIRKILVQNPEDRLSLKEIKNHPWCQKNRNEEQKLIPLFDEFAHLIPTLEERYQKHQQRKQDL